MKNEILIRQALTDDAMRINALTEELGYKNSLAETTFYLNVIGKDIDHVIFVAVLDGLLIAWIEVAVVTRLESGPFCEIVGLVVDQKYRRLSVGKQLVNNAIEWSKEKNSPRIRVRCNIKRKEAHLFYEHSGFTIIKEQKVFELKLTPKN